MLMTSDYVVHNVL